MFLTGSAATAALGSMPPQTSALKVSTPGRMCREEKDLNFIVFLIYKG